MKKLTIMRIALLGGAGLSALAGLPGLALAQDASSEDEVAEGANDAIVVTGTRVQRNGYDAPTPVTAVDAIAINKAAPANIADYLNQLPQLTGTSTSRNANGNTSTGTAGLNLLDLRGLGSNRTLVLIDGQRVAPSTQTGAVDVNNVPTSLLQRVDVVTGGASAAYGSDAIAGVVNFVIDRKFSGIKLNVNGGITDRGDNKNYQFTGSFGTSFADGRGHFIISAEHQHEDGIDQIDPAKRQWFKYQYLVPGTGGLVIADNVYYNNVAQGSVINGVILTSGATRNFITSGALTNTTNPFFGTQFGAGGAVTPFVYGTLAGNFMIGGNPWNEGTAISMLPRIDRTNAWGMVSYEFSPAVKFTLEGSYGKTHTLGSAAYQRNVNNIIVSAQNAFLPASVRATATANGIAQLRLGYGSVDLGRMRNDIERENYRIVGTLSGDLGGGWGWQAYYQHGRTNLDIQLLNTTDNTRFTLALDAVDQGLETTGTANGKIICRSTIANPTNGCVPLNIFGTGVATPEQIAYVKGTAWQNQKITQDVAAVSITGSPFNAWAGPVSFAAGAEYRKESVVAVGDPVSAGFVSNPAVYDYRTPPTGSTGFFTGNFKSNAGSYDVKEAFAEVVFPLLKDSGVGNADLNGAVRLTDYSTSGTVTTWKAGLTWSPVEDVKFRGVVSRDIRAPNLQELYSAGSSQAVDVVVPTGQTKFAPGTVRITQITDGNTALTPEKADTLSLGVVLKLSRIPGLSASIDYYNIRLKNAISTLAVNDIVSRCIGGESLLCSFIQVIPSTTTIQSIRRAPVNIANQQVRGMDFDVSYTLPFDGLFKDANGQFSVRFLASKVFTYSFTNAGVTNQAVGELGGPFANPPVPSWRTYTTLGYDSDKASLGMTMRTISGGVYDVAIANAISPAFNHIDRVTYFDLAGSFTLFGSGRDKTELYFKIDNLFDRDPPLVAGNASSTPNYSPTLYDGIGRAYRLGIRARF